MAPDQREAAIDTLRALRERLGGGAADPAAAEECEQLIRAVEAFHMEGARFRMHGLRRRLTAGGSPASEELLQLLDAAGDALRAAGFGIRSGGRT